MQRRNRSGALTGLQTFLNAYRSAPVLYSTSKRWN